MNVYGDWAIKAAVNAKQLAAESKILLQHKCKARAYYLAHMSVEESSKSILLYAAHVGGTPISEIDKVKKLLSNHKKRFKQL
jgi:AbiV family abortive infection protein